MNAAALRTFLLGAAMLAPFAGLWAGLIRIGWQWPTAGRAALSHGPLMIRAFWAR
jgi:hypothetical protein